MVRLLWLFSLALGLLAPTDGRAQCRIEWWDVFASTTKATLAIGFEKCPSPTEVWIEHGPAANLDRASVVSFRVDGLNRAGDGAATGYVKELAPDTEYYIRGHVRTADGMTALGPVVHYKTAAISSVPIPKCRYRSHGSLQRGDQDGLQFTFLCNDRWSWGASVSLMIGADPRMTNAEPKDSYAIYLDRPPEESLVPLFVANDALPNAPAVYVQLRAETWWGIGRSDVVRVALPQHTK